MEAGARTAGRRRLVGQSRGGVKRAGRKDDRGSQGERRGGKAAGDRALLVTLTTADGSRYMYAYVQVGRIWTEFMVPNQLARPNQPASQADGTRLAQKAAERMRNAQR